MIDLVDMHEHAQPHSGSMPASAARGAGLRACKGAWRAQSRSMMHYNELVPARAGDPVPHADRLRLAAAAYLARFKGTSRDHTDSDLRCYLT
jgi:hypothetical protein